MTDSELLDMLLVAGPEDRRHLLEKNAPLEMAFFLHLQESVRETRTRDTRRALEMSDVGLEAIPFAREPEAAARAWWARGNVLLVLLHNEECLAAFSTASAILADLEKDEEVAKLQVNRMVPLMMMGRHAEAQALGHQALGFFEDRGDPWPLAHLNLNLAVCALHRGSHAEAAARSDRAALLFVQVDEMVESARCRLTQAWALECVDRFGEAKTLLQDALAVFAEHDRRVPWARAALNLGVLHNRLHDFQAALRWLEQSRSAFLAAGVEAEAAVVDLYRTQCFLDVGLLPEAKARGEASLGTFDRLKMPRQVARAALLLAEIHARSGQFEPAHRELERARRVFRALGDAMEVAHIDLQSSDLLRRMGQPGRGLRLATEAAEPLDAGRYPLRHAKAHLVIAACCEDLGRVEEAQAAYQVAWVAGARPTGTTEPPPGVAYRVAFARGAIAQAAGQRTLARGEYDRAVTYLSRIAQGLGLDELRGGYLDDKRPVYEAALHLALAENRVADGFRYSELARAGTLRDLLTSGRRRPPDDHEDRQRLVELRNQWAWRASSLQRPVDLLAESEDDPVQQTDRAECVRELAELEKELEDIFRRRRLGDPRFAVLEQGAVLEPQALSRYLPDDTALISFDTADGNLLAFVVSGGQTRAVPLGSLAELRWDAAGLGHALEEIRLFDDPADRSRVEHDLKEQLQSLYHSVMHKPLACLGPNVHRLAIVPCDVLSTLPLEACHDGERYLVERYSVSYLPSASLLAALPSDRVADAGPPLVMGHSWEGRLPLALAEARAVASTLEEGSRYAPHLLTEEEATSAALYQNAPAAGLVHVAAHGVFRADAPLFSSIHLADAPLTVNEVYSLDLTRAALVVLSGCQTGLGRQRGGEMLGLAHAFFFAGAPALVVSRWRVEDDATTRLMQDFYAHLAEGKSIAKALRAAQLNSLTGSAHAGLWAAFAAWGQEFAVGIGGS